VKQKWTNNFHGNISQGKKRIKA